MLLIPRASVIVTTAGQPFRHDGHGKRDAGEEHLEQILALENTGRGNQHRYGDRHDPEPGTK